MTDYGSIKSRLEDFDARHGENIYHDGWILFANGARREGNALGLLAEPPDHPLPLAQCKLRYHEIVLQCAVDEFTRRKNEMVRAARRGLNGPNCEQAPVDIPQATAVLQQLKAVVTAAKKRRDAALADVEAATPVSVKERARRLAELRAQNEVLLTSINQIEV